MCIQTTEKINGVNKEFNCIRCADLENVSPSNRFQCTDSVTDHFERVCLFVECGIFHFDAHRLWAFDQQLNRYQIWRASVGQSGNVCRKEEGKYSRTLHRKDQSHGEQFHSAVRFEIQKSDKINVIWNVGGEEHEKHR